MCVIFDCEPGLWLAGMALELTQWLACMPLYYVCCLFLMPTICMHSRIVMAYFVLTLSCRWIEGGSRERVCGVFFHIFTIFGWISNCQHTTLACLVGLWRLIGGLYCYHTASTITPIHSYMWVYFVVCVLAASCLLVRSLFSFVGWINIVRMLC